ncbi:MAG: DNA-binding protein [Lachnospiraceae bacterium]|nr:DNA-binding protein [Lachnospiraceae bacterium]
MDKLVKRAVLFDHYGELLNDKQKRIVEYTVSEDMSLSEIGEQEGITRQAASDLLKRADERLLEFEDKLGMIRKTKNILERVGSIREHGVDGFIENELKNIENELGI